MNRDPAPGGDAAAKRPADPDRPSGEGEYRKTLLKLTYLRAAEERLREADALMNQARRLDPPGSEEEPALQRAVLLARLQFKRGQTADAFRSFAALLDQAESLLPPQRFLEFAGHFLEIAAAQPGRLDVKLLSRLANRAQGCLTGLLSAAGTQARQAREECQQPLEDALAALLKSARRSGLESNPGQRLLAKAWALVMAAGREDPGSRRQAGEASGVRRQASRGESGIRNPDPEAWRLEPGASPPKACRLKPDASPKPDASQPPRQGAALAFFLFRNPRPFHDAPLLVLAGFQGEIRMRLIPNAALRIIPQLLEWGRNLERGNTTKGTKGTKGERSEPDAQQILPRELAWLASRKPAGPQSGKDQAEGCPEALFSGPWHIFPTGVFHSVPFEAMPDTAGSPTCWGQKRDVRMRLGSSSAAAGISKKVDFSKGWAGLGAASPFGQAPQSEGSMQEVRCLRSLLVKEGLRAQTLNISRACPWRLLERLAGRRTGVLHLAAQELFEGAHLLADGPAEGDESLTLQRLGELDLSSTELVVLSGFPGLDQGMGLTAGVELLAGTFLAAGAQQVIARRCPVDPNSARTFLLSLYGLLLKHPAAAALGRARDECLRQQGLGSGEVGAWSIWV